MHSKSDQERQTKSILMKTSRVIGGIQEGVEEHEITAQVSVPHEGGWGWVVVFSAFFSIFVLDGVAYTIGSMLSDIAQDLKVPDSLVAFVNSTAVALYFMVSPLASALINRFGFRGCAMSGSIICSFALFSSYFTPKFTYLFLFYGIVAGFGYALINMSSSLIVGFYFEKLRSLALAVASCGSSIGVMIMFPLNAYLVKLDGWRTTTLLHSGLFGIIFFLGMTYRPLLSLTITKTEEDTTHSGRLVTYLPSVTSTSVRSTSSKISIRSHTIPTATERLFSAVSNVKFPTAAAVVEDSTIPVIKEIQSATTITSQAGEAGPSSGVGRSKSKMTFTPHNIDGALSQKQMKEMQSIVSKTTVDLNVAGADRPEQIKEKKIFRRLFNWEPHVRQARPLYRDDAFYEGYMKNLPEYQKSMMDHTKEGRTGLEYRMAVTRAVTVTDLNEHRGVFTTAVRRVLATMMDPSLLKRRSFLLLCCSGFLTYLGFLVPYVYLKDRNISAGVDPRHCTLFISAIGISNAVGRLVLGSIASKIDPLKLFSFWCIIAGVSTIASNVSYDIYYQYSYCFVFGFSISSVACLRSVILVSLYGLDKLTNATGMMLIFLGLGNLMSTPLAGIVKNTFGYSLAFYISGTFIALSGLVLIPVKFFAYKEKKAIDEIEEIRTRQQARVAAGKQQT